MAGDDESLSPPDSPFHGFSNDEIPRPKSIKVSRPSNAFEGGGSLSNPPPAVVFSLY